jgi:hypothetical protein
MCTNVDSALKALEGRSDRLREEEQLEEAVLADDLRYAGSERYKRERSVEQELTVLSSCW